MASLRSLDSRVQSFAQWFVRHLQRQGVTVTVASTRRDPADQARLYAAYKAGRSKYPAAAPGHSTHERGLAMDLHLDPPVYAEAGRIWESYGLTWGGRFSDEIHFDFRPRA